MPDMRQDWQSPLVFFTSLAVVSYAVLSFKDWMAKRERRGLPPLVTTNMVAAITTVIVVLFRLVLGFFVVLVILGLFRGCA